MTNTELAPAQPTLPEMTRPEAEHAAERLKDATSNFKRSLGRIRELAVEFSERRGYAALGFTTMEACAKTLFGWHRVTFWRVLQAATIERQLGVEVGTLPGAQASALARVPVSRRREVYDAASANGPATAARVTEEATRRLPPESALPIDHRAILRDVVEKEELERLLDGEPWDGSDNASVDAEPEQIETLPLDGPTHVAARERPSAPTIHPQGPDRHPATPGGRERHVEREAAGVMDPEDLDWLVTPIERTALRKRKASLGDVLAAYWRLVARAEAEQDTRARMVARAILKGGD